MESLSSWGSVKLVLSKNSFPTESHIDVKKEEGSNLVAGGMQLFCNKCLNFQKSIMNALKKRVQSQNF